MNKIWKFIGNRSGKNTVLMNKLVYLGLSILELSKYSCMSFGMMVWLCETKICWKSKILCTLNADDIYKDIIEEVETRFDTPNYELDRPLRKGKKVSGLIKD